MAKFTPDDLMGSILDMLYGIITGGNGKVPPSPEKFVTWCAPGIPIDAEEMQFAKQGIGAAADAEEMKKYMHQAYNFSTLVDFIPDVNSVYDADSQQHIYNTDGRRLSKMYGDILKYSKVSKSDLTQEQKDKIKKFWDLLFEEKEEKNLVTDAVTTVVEDGKITKLYNDTMMKYEEARIDYSSKAARVASASGKDDKGLVLDWSMNEDLYYKKITRAMDDWTAKGYKNEVDDMNAYIGQVTMRSLKLWKQELLNFYTKGVRATTDGLPYYYTQPIPGNFAESKGWTEFSFKSSDIKKVSESNSTQWSAGLSVGGAIKLLPFSIGGTAEGGKTETLDTLDTSDISISFEFTQVLLSRAWFYPSFFSNRGWITSPEWNTQYSGENPSDGLIPPNGNFIAYPMRMLVIRNLTIESKDFSEKITSLKKSLDIKPEGGIGWGPFKIELKGGYSKTSSKDTEESTLTENGMKVPGMQIIGFVNNLIPKSPNPLPELSENDFE